MSDHVWLERLKTSAMKKKAREVTLGLVRKS